MATQIITQPRITTTQVTPQLGLIYLGLLISLTIVFALSPIPYDDWITFRLAALHVFSPALYQNTGYFNPPYVALLLLPLAQLNVAWGYGILCASSLLLLTFICYRANMHALKMGLLLASPPVVYLLLHGQIDVLVFAAALLLPRAWRGLAVLAKPQVALGIIARMNKLSFMLTGITALVIYIIWLPYLGAQWPLDLLRSMSVVSDVGWNVTRLAFMPLGWLLLYYAWRWQDDALAIAASPLLVTYAAPSSLIGISYLLMLKAPLLVCVTVWLAAWILVLHL